MEPIEKTARTDPFLRGGCCENETDSKSDEKDEKDEKCPPSDTLLKSDVVETETQFKRMLELNAPRYASYFSDPEQFELFMMLPVNTTQREELIQTMKADELAKRTARPATDKKSRHARGPTLSEGFFLK